MYNQINGHVCMDFITIYILYTNILIIYTIILMRSTIVYFIKAQILFKNGKILGFCSYCFDEMLNVLKLVKCCRKISNFAWILDCTILIYHFYLFYIVIYYILYWNHIYKLIYYQLYLLDKIHSTWVRIYFCT